MGMFKTRSEQDCARTGRDMALPVVAQSGFRANAPSRLQKRLEVHVGKGSGPQETSPQGSFLWEVAEDGRHAGLVDASQTRVELGSD